MTDILSQAEIDALLDQVADAEHEAPSRPGSPLGVRTYDLTGQQRIERGRLSGLESMNQRLATRLRRNIADLLQQDVEVVAQAVVVKKYGDYAHELSLPGSFNLISLAPLRGAAMIALDARLVFGLIDSFFGGSGRPCKIEGRDFTETENRVIQSVLERLCGDLEDVWRGVVAFSCKVQATELNPALAGIVATNESVVVSGFQVGLAGVVGKLQLILPESMIEPLRDSLDAVTRGNSAELDRRWRQSLEQQLGFAPVSLRCRVAEKELELRELAELEVGDFMPLDLRRGSELTVDGVPVHRVRVGIFGGHWAVKLEQE